MTRVLALLIYASGISASVAAQSNRSATVDQIPSASSSSTVRVQPVSGASSSSSAQPERPVAESMPSAPNELVEACRAAQNEDRPGPEGVDCVAVLQTPDAVEPGLTAEGSLLELFGQRSNVTGSAGNSVSTATSADAVARQISTGDFQAGSEAAAVAARERAAPPSDSPPGQ